MHVIIIVKVLRLTSMNIITFPPVHKNVRDAQNYSHIMEYTLFTVTSHIVHISS